MPLSPTFLTASAAAITIHPDSLAADRLNASSGKRCLVEGSLVLTPDGKTRPVEACRVGQMLGTFERVSRAVLPTRITDVWLQHIRDGYCMINNELRITADHPVLLAGADWTLVERLTVGDRILSPVGGIDVLSIVSIERQVVTVYLETEHDNYLAQGERGPYVVHGHYADQARATSASTGEDDAMSG
jgi:hypothetical protein